MSETENLKSSRLDHYVAGHLPQRSRAFGTKLIEQGRVSVNGIAQTKAGYRLRSSDTVEIDYDENLKVEIPAIELPIVYEDNDCVVINKPVGLLTHSKGAFNPEPSVATWLAGRLTDMRGDRAGIVHRLDRATSGVMICAKSPEALSWLQKQFSLRKVKKTYAAVVIGQLDPMEAVIDMPIERNPKKPQTFRVGSNGKTAITNYKVLRAGDKYSLLELKPLTGRTHQLRVHLTHIGHPIVGDTFYGQNPAERLYLHAQSLEITLLNRQRQIFTVEVPIDFNEQI